MESRTIPNTRLEVSPVCLGTMTFGTPVGEGDAIGIVHWALDQGVNFIDTANMYEGYNRVLGSAGGVAEDCIGKALVGRRGEAVLATKVGHPIGPEPGDMGLSRAHIERECDKSLKRLATDYIDLYYMHAPYPDTPIEESIATFVDLIGAGKVRHWGLSNFDAAQTREVLLSCDANGWQRPVVHQPPYSLLKRDAEVALLPFCRQEDIGVVPYQILQGGLLSGKYRNPATPPPGSRAAEKPEWVPLLQDEEVRRELDRLSALSTEQGLSLFDYAVQTTANTPGITSIIMGVKNTGQLKDAIRALSQ